MITTISSQGRRRYRQFGGPSQITFLPSVGSPSGVEAAFPVQYQSYCGRFSRGQYINFILSIDQLPDDVPVMTVWKDGTDQIEEMEIPRVRAASRIFRLTRLLGNQYDDGQYVAVMRFDYNGDTYCSINYFSVSGGTGTAPNIAISEIDRAAGRAVVTQSDDGFMRLGYKPKRLLP